MKIKKRDSAAIIDALSSGVVPRRGLQYIMVGRVEEVKQILRDLDNVKEGASLVKFYIGEFGTGKSFIQGLIKQVGLSKNFVVTNADLSPEKRLYGAEKAILLYTELIKNLSTSTCPEGGALSVIIDKWISALQTKVMKDKGYETIDFSDEALVSDVENEIVKEVSKLDKLSGGYDFARILTIYYKGFIDGDLDIQRKALRWISGEYGTRTEAKNDLGVREIIDDSNYYNYIKVMAQFVRQIGYAGLVINFDEAINLYKITHPQAREKNYETILNMFNDCLQGNVEGLYITFAGTPEFLEDERRGLYSYGALRRRLELNRYETDEFRDLTQPVIKLSPLSHEDLFVLLQRIRDIHSFHYKYKSDVSDDELKAFIIKEFSVPGAKQYTTVGHIVKRFIDALNILYQNPDFDRRNIFGDSVYGEYEQVEENDNIMDRFQVYKGR